MLSRVWLCNPVDHSPPGSSVQGIFQARILEWVAISSFRESSWPTDWTCISCISRWILYHWATWEDPTNTQESHDYNLSLHQGSGFSTLMSIFFLNWWWSLVTFCSISQDLFCHRWMWVIVAQLCPTLCNPWTSSRQEHWSGLSFPSPGDHPNPGIEHGSSALQADSLPSETPGKPTSKRHL